MSPDRLIKDALRLLNEGDTDAARRLAGDALAATPGNATAFNALGRIETSAMNFDEARQWHKRAVDAAPDNSSFHVHLADMLIQMGEFSEAEEVLNALLTKDPANGAAWQFLAWIKKATASDPLIGKLQDVLNQDTGAKRNRARLLFALGKWFDDLGEYDKAFEQYREANRLRATAFDRNALLALIERIKTVWTKDFIDARKAGGFQSEKPVFIVGMPRSGSTLLERKLCADPRIKALGERPEIIKIANLITRNHPRKVPYPDWAPDLPIEAYGGLGKLYVEKFETMHPGAERFLDKALTSFGYVGFIRAILPKAHIIEARRNPLDTCLSCYFQDLNDAHNYKADLSSLGFTYRLYADLMEHWKCAIDRFTRVDYERFIGNADENAQSLRNEIGLAPLENEKNSDEKGGINTWSAFQARQPVYKSSVARWKNYEKHLGPLIEELGDLVS